MTSGTAIEPHSGQRRQEVRALSRLGFDELGRLPMGIWGMQRAISGRVFWGVSRGLGPLVKPVQLAQETVTEGVYGALRGATGLLGSGVDAALRRLPVEGPPLSTTPRGSLALGALQGLRGDALEAEASPLAQPMAVRVKGEPLPLEPEALAEAFPAASGRLVVFLHGLMETELSWRLGGRPTYGELLADQLGCTPVDVRYNSGLHISDNGRRLSALLEELVEAWPVQVDEVALVGHSMGGLVSRSACHVAAADGARWVRSVRHLIYLGAPHLGAPLEKAVNAAGAALNAIGETRPAARALERRSVGIKDLRFGSVVDDDWRDCDPDALLDDRCTEVPLLEDAEHYVVSAAIGPEDGPLGGALGDLLVRIGSATGRGRRRSIAFADGNGRHFPGLNHFQLLSHPAVYEQIRAWLGGDLAGA